MTAYSPGADLTAQPLPSTMRAATRSDYGSTERVVVDRVDRPEPGATEVLIHVAAAGLDRATVHLLEGKPYLARLAFGVRRPRQAVLGQQVAGRIVAVGSAVTGRAVGERVFGTASGAFAEYAVAKEATIAPTPVQLSDDIAATLGVSGVTAYAAVVGRARVQAGQRVLILGASGAVGTYAVQLASQLGADVTGVCSASKRDLVRSFGAKLAVDYAGLSLADLPDTYDAIIDIAGNRPLRKLRSALAADGILVIVGGEAGGSLLGGIERNLFASLVNRFTTQRLGWLFASPTTENLALLADALVSGNLQPPLDRCVDLAGLGPGIEDMQQGRLRGHVIVHPG
ncbi:NAD(P)-dependent alcohol dehydrogenase [Nostocoides veronense]|uniref:NAD(P)-dependent alcohol dehydrogenase n=1 Tax=Nostocoides veronense TaxID=330836 RepID=A0ABN2LE78_9MICO